MNLLIDQSNNKSKDKLSGQGTKESINKSVGHVANQLSKIWMNDEMSA